MQRVAENREGTSLARATVVVASLFVASRLLGLVRDILIAARFGTSPDYDAYVAAFRLPDLVFLVVMSGAFGSAFIPVYIELLTQESRQTAWRLANALLTLTLTVFLVVTASTLVVADALIRLVVAPGLPSDTQELAANLTRILMLSPLFLGTGSAAKAMLESESRFATPAFAPLLYNLGIIFGAIVLAPFAGIYGLAYGVVLGAAAYATLQLSALHRAGWRFRVVLSRRIRGLPEVLSLLGPRLIAQAAMQVNLLVTTNLASRLGHQSIASLQYAYQIFLLPHGVVALSLATVLFPTLAQYRSAGALEDLHRTFAPLLRIAVLVTLPAVVFFGFFPRAIVQTVFQVGAFTATSTSLVAEALRWFAPGLLAYAVVELLTRLSYAFKDSRSPVLAALVAVGANTVFGLALMHPFGHRGLALSLALATTLEMFVLAYLLRRSLGIPYGPLFRGLGRAVPAVVALTVAAHWFARPLEQATDPARGRSIGQLLVFGYTLASLGIAYAVVLLLARQSDARSVFLAASARLPRPVRRLCEAILEW
ncbi:MAG: murein biosynthesis integral membrane protein MurJ [Thermomicrobium sp.]|nr:murein biosynthesis integral membrane protein MurJ [Thermomicrobium sp.]MDW8058941.1 murein biosynthesis integral membrane protein MurJ [Thermomicrobium sp.]